MIDTLPAMAFETTDLALAFCMMIGAALYSSVGHAGASAYIALMALFGVPPAVIRPTALVLNIIVASFGSARFIRAGMFRWRTLWPLLIGALPFAFLGGAIKLPGEYYRPLVGVVLLLSALRLLWPKELKATTEWKDPPVWLAVICGAGIGLLAGLTGTGGGIFLSPLLLFMAWSTPKPASGIAAVFILCNSVSGLLGNFSQIEALPPALPLYACAVLLGGLVGTTLGIRLATPAILKALSVVLLVAGAKLIGVY
ncbi:sulfite exporter TauE/SafE family protein [Sphingomonas sp.]|uniref:sulfite exporter TauE/SafE family protein n=1 Tax=Sphingomonas sp. TaxID=28214 RepID=UPI002ED98CAF